MGVGDACGRQHWGLRWSSLWGHETCEGWAKVGVVTYAIPASGALGGAPYEATKRMRGGPKWAWSPMRFLPLGPSVELRIRQGKDPAFDFVLPSAGSSDVLSPRQWDEFLVFVARQIMRCRHPLGISKLARAPRGAAQAPQARRIIRCRHRPCNARLAQAPQALVFVGAGTAHGEAQAPQARQIIRCRHPLGISKLARAPRGAAQAAQARRHRRHWFLSAQAPRMARRRHRRHVK